MSFLIIDDFFSYFLCAISVSPTGMNFLRTSTSEHQPPLVLPITSEMVDEEEHRDAHGRVDGDLQNLASLECEGLSEVKTLNYLWIIVFVSICIWNCGSMFSIDSDKAR